MIMGFIVILSIYQQNMSRRSVEVVENVVDAYVNTAAHQIAVSGMNIAASRLYQDMGWRTGVSSVSFQGGTFNISFGAGIDTVEVIIAASFRSFQDTIRAYFSGSRSYTEYAVFTDDENGMAWTPGDTVWGPMHTNGIFNHQNKSDIVFYGKVTAGKNIASPPKNSKTKFLGGYEVGVFLPAIPPMTSLPIAAASGGYTFPSPGDTMKIEFKSNGNIVIHQNSIPLFPDPGTPMYTIAPNGAIYSAGNYGRHLTGGEVVYYDPKTAKRVSWRKEFEPYNITSLCVMSGGETLACTAVLRETKAPTLFVIDAEKRVIARKTELKLDSGAPGIIMPSGLHAVLGVATKSVKDEKTGEAAHVTFVYRLDVETGKVLSQKQMPGRAFAGPRGSDFGGVDREIAIGPDGCGWFFIDKTLVRITPDGAIEKVKAMPHGARILWVGDDLYFYNGGRQWYGGFASIWRMANVFGRK